MDVLRISRCTGHHKNHPSDAFSLNIRRMVSWCTLAFILFCSALLSALCCFCIHFPNSHHEQQGHCDFSCPSRGTHARARHLVREEQCASSHHTRVHATRRRIVQFVYARRERDNDAIEGIPHRLVDRTRQSVSVRTGVQSVHIPPGAKRDRESVLRCHHPRVNRPGCRVAQAHYLPTLSLSRTRTTTQEKGSFPWSTSSDPPP